ncbi:dymeclin [Cephus cinctus]|uniref:Dymeclin n=1 Tax=Cephus cinctus TaxID=211228 RepID=A0AAJ7BR12_CEPCN|nr:dymeclin [Cephus cinctus]
MGATSSQYEDLSKNPYLLKFSGKKPISPDDPFWNQFLSYNLRPPATRNDQIKLDSQLNSIYQQFLINNMTTGNFGSLLQVSLIRTNELLATMQSQDILYAWQTYNALFAVRCVLKYLIETVGEEEIARHAEAVAPSQEPLHPGQSQVTRLETFFESLVEIIVNVSICQFWHRKKFSDLYKKLVLTSSL